ncbi:MBL fold metallo-hydrolase [Geomicrobium sp. JCM 19037]|uniref:MBL fold metallo-hydrolase n=1 Tax=Geomicrobium sp. JCM 19037 TaxID=1460634 RepID=UPI00187CB681|nr:MBL fold metallo-hydrolase [Geomicrobium sp. JCM 19037]
MMQKLFDHTYLIDGLDLGMKERTGIYVLDNEQLTIIETGPSQSFEPIRLGLKQLGYKMTDISHIILTHIHLDHAGGAGQLVQHATNARVHVHPSGYKHLIDPTKLIEGARVVYGDAFDRTFAPVLPVPKRMVVSQEDGAQLSIGNNRTLTFFHTPGHAMHHISILDSETNGIFTGDTVAVYYKSLSDRHNQCVSVPSTSPSQFDPAMMANSWEKIRRLSPDVLYLGHFGAPQQTDQLFLNSEQLLEKFIDALRTESQDAKRLARVLQQTVQDYYQLEQLTDDESNMLNVDCQVSALGLIHAYEKGRIELDG